jgi:HEAT repeat protein
MNRDLSKNEMAGLRKKSRIGLVAVLGLAAIGLVLYASRTNEPSFQGRALSHWLSDIENARDDREAEPAKYAVRQIGTNAIPSLLSLMRAEDSRLKQTIIFLLRKQRIFRLRIADATSKHLRSALGFEALGAEARSAVPDLKRMLDHPKTVYLAGMALISISPGGVDAVVSGLGSTNVVVRRESAGVLGALGIERFWSKGSEARMDALQARGHIAVPPLINALIDPDELVRARAATALGVLGQRPEIALPALIKNLRDTNGWRVPASAAKALGRFGPDAASAVPALKEAAQHKDSRVREAAEGAIRALETQAEPRLE